jgi:hypothetical protein
VESKQSWRANPWRARTERRTETRSSSKDYADAEDNAVNQQAPKSVERKELAPREEHTSEHGFGESGEASILHAVNRSGRR